MRVSGRLRIPAELRALEQRLAASRDITSIRCNTDAASIVVEYAGSFEALRAKAWDAGTLILEAGEDTPPEESTASIPPALVAPRLVRVTKSRVYRALRDGHNRTAIENLVHAIAAWRTARDPWLAALLACGAAAQIARGDVLSSVLAVAFRTIDAAQRHAEFA